MSRTCRIKTALFDLNNTSASGEISRFPILLLLFFYGKILKIMTYLMLTFNRLFSTEKDSVYRYRSMVKIRNFRKSVDIYRDALYTTSGDRFVEFLKIRYAIFFFLAFRKVESVRDLLLAIEKDIVRFSWRSEAPEYKLSCNGVKKIRKTGMPGDDWGRKQRFFVYVIHIELFKNW